MLWREVRETIPDLGQKETYSTEMMIEDHLRIETKLSLGETSLAEMTTEDRPPIEMKLKLEESSFIEMMVEGHHVRKQLKQ